MAGVLAVSRVCLLDALGCPEGWAVVHAAGVSVYPSPAHHDQLPPIKIQLDSQTRYGLQVDGIYRRCGLASKVSRLVEALRSHPDSAPMEDDEQGILDVGSALKQYPNLMSQPG
ncbi:hypothetical protein CRUP_025788 [Coryphaenoides rupestris]|nr:hypothetical protein CRUP_025788 [Coryphaenoides rupestris]